MTTISVAIPVFNRAHWIRDTLETMWAQERLPDEVVICDDGSTDELGKALEPFEEDVKVVRIENSGPAIARKTAVENSSGEWVALCDSDDRWEPNHLRCFVESLKKEPKFDFYFTNFKISDNLSHSKFDNATGAWASLNSGKPKKATSVVSGISLYQALLDYQACFQSTIIFRKDFYDAIGGINVDVARMPSEDLHLTLRMAAHGTACIQWHSTVLINKHDENYSGKFIKTLEGEVAILKMLLENGDLPSDLTGITKEEALARRTALFRNYYWDGQFRKMLNAFRELPMSAIGPRDYARLIIGLFKTGF